MVKPVAIVAAFDAVAATTATSIVHASLPRAVPGVSATVTVGGGTATAAVLTDAATVSHSVWNACVPSFSVAAAGAGSPLKLMLAVTVNSFDFMADPSWQE